MLFGWRRTDHDRRQRKTAHRHVPLKRLLTPNRVHVAPAAGLRPRRQCRRPDGPARSRSPFGRRQADESAWRRLDHAGYRVRTSALPRRRTRG